MKFKALFAVLSLTAFFVLGTSSTLEAKHRNYFSFNVGPVFPTPSYVVQSYPTYVQQVNYIDPWGVPYTEAVYVRPAPRVCYPAYPGPAVSFGYGWMFR